MTKKKTSQGFYLQIDLFKFRYNLMIGQSVYDIVMNDKQLEKLYRTMFNTDSDMEHFLANCNGLCSHFPEDDLYIMILPEHAKAPLIAHEALHMVMYLLQDKGIPVNESTEEIVAILLEEIVRQVIDSLECGMLP